MAEIVVKAEREYKVRITGDWRGDLSPWVSKRDRVAVIYSSAMPEIAEQLNFSHSEVLLLPVPDGEAGKSSQVLDHLWSQLGRAGFTRSDLIVAIGGGTITDLGGFVAASWLRGIDWIAIPTTIAGMVDASVGGKTGINSPFGKNLIGAFHSPSSVLIDTSWLTTLSDRDFRAGLAEVVKCGFIQDPKILELLKDKSLSDVRGDAHLTIELIQRAITTKATVVSEDFKESSLREILNYGHTFGHAIERVSEYSIRHGEAVSIGLVFAAELAHDEGLLDDGLLSLHREALSSLGLPTALGSIPGAENWRALFAAIALDKKSRGSEIRFVAITELGKCTRIEGVSEEQLIKAYEKVLS